jgi:uncharacterized protein (DUF2141 family)
MARVSLGLVLGVVAWSVAAGAQESAPVGASLEVVVADVTSDRGTVLVGLYATSETWMKQDRAHRLAKVKAARGTVRASFPGLQPGRYAVSVIHDENDNGKFDMRWFPFPSPAEHGGSSNNVMSRLGPPSFDKALFDVTAGARTVEVKLWK